MTDEKKILTGATGGPSDQKMDELVKKVRENTDYKVLSKEEYDKLLALASAKNIVTSTPQVTEPAVKPKFTFQTPNISPVPRLRHILNTQSNVSYQAQPFHVPKLPTFNGTEQGGVTYEVWSLEVRCLQNNPFIPDHIVLQSIRDSLKGSARSMLVPLGEKATVDDILNKFEGFYGNVSTGETLIQSFYNDYQRDTESIVDYGSRLEQTLSRAVRCGHIDLVAKDAMLRSKFWTGLKSQQLRNSTRHLYDSVKDFQTLLREIRKVESEDSNSSRPASKKTAQQQSGQADTDQMSTDTISKQLSELMTRMKLLEQRLENQQQTSANVQPSFQQNNSYPSQRGRGSYRGQNRGNFSRGNYGNRYTRGNFQSSRAANKGVSSRGNHQGGTSGRGANQGGSSSGGNQPLNS